VTGQEVRCCYDVRWRIILIGLGRIDLSVVVEEGAGLVFLTQVSQILYPLIVLTLRFAGINQSLQSPLSCRPTPTQFEHPLAHDFPTPHSVSLPKLPLPASPRPDNMFRRRLVYPNSDVPSRSYRLARPLGLVHVGTYGAW
jgi:hypothetical protein